MGPPQGLADDAGAVSHRTLRTWPRAADRDEVLLRVETAVNEILSEAGPVEAIGVGLPATMDVASGIAVGSRHLPIVGFAFRDWLHERFGLPVFVDNDATLALLAEARMGAARGVPDAVMLTIGTGIGGGLMSAGRLIRGARGSAGEPGHMTIDA